MFYYNRFEISNRLTLAILISICVCIFDCAVPTENNEDAPDMELSLEQKGRYEAEFFGESITALLYLREAVPYEDIAWTLGNAKKGNVINLRTNEPITTNTADSVSRVSLELYWITKPANDDAVDSIYASIGGGVKRSNKVSVFVSNIAPSIDSITLDTIGYNKITQMHPDSVIKFEILYEFRLDTVHMKLQAKDLEDRDLSIQWKAREQSRILSDITSQSKNEASYLVPDDHTFNDTVTVSVYDKDGGQVMKKIVFYCNGPNLAPLVDSVVVDTFRFTDFTDMPSYYNRVIDTLSFFAFAHDSFGDSIFPIWRANNGTFTADKRTPFKQNYISSDETTKIPLYDSARAVDTVWITIADNREESTTVAVEIIQGMPNREPEIDSVVVDDGDETQKFSASQIPFAYLSNLDDTLEFTIYASDPDLPDSVLNYNWSANNNEVFLDAPGNSASADYICGNTAFLDSISVTISDRETQIKTGFAVYVGYESPTIDSLILYGTVDTSTFKGDPAFYIFYGDAASEIPMRAFISSSTEDYTMQWNSSRLGTDVGNASREDSATYNAQNDVYMDTVQVILMDEIENADTAWIELTIE